MTMIHLNSCRCAVCGTEEVYTIIRSTNAFGAPDLDTRPSQMARSTIHAWVQRCPKCGYCSSDITTAPSQAASLVRSPKYMRQLDDLSYPELANSFLCQAHIDESLGEYAEAAWACIAASWTCDDDEKPRQARACRNKAVDMIEQALHKNQQVAKQDGTARAIQVDLLRRAGRLTEAWQLIQAQRPEITDDFILKMLVFQETLIARGDEACHTIEAIEDSE